MTAKIHLPKPSLYEKDFNLWLLTTLEQLSAARFQEVNNVIEDVSVKITKISFPISITSA